MSERERNHIKRITRREQASRAVEWHSEVPMHQGPYMVYRGTRPTYGRSKAQTRQVQDLLVTVASLIVLVGFIAI